MKRCATDYAGYTASTVAVTVSSVASTARGYRCELGEEGLVAAFLQHFTLCGVLVWVRYGDSNIGVPYQLLNPGNVHWVRCACAKATEPHWRERGIDRN